jgi:hypothetical protein
VDIKAPKLGNFILNYGKALIAIFKGIDVTKLEDPSE